MNNIERALPNSLSGFYLINSGYTANHLKFGELDSSLELDFLKRRNRNNFNTNLFLKKLQIEYFISYQSYTNNNLNLLALKDLYISTALGYLTRNCQYKSMNMTNINTASKLFNSVRKSYTPIPQLNGGLIGTLSWWLKDIPNFKEYQTLDLIELILIKFWQNFNINPTISPKKRMKALIDYLKIDLYDWTYISSKLTYYFNSNSNLNTEDIELAKYIRQNLLTPKDWTDLRERILLLELDQYLVNAIDSLLVLENKQLEYTVEGLIRTLLNFGDGCTILAAYVAFLIEGLVSTSRYIVCLDEALLIAPLIDVMLDPVYSQIINQIATHLATTYDACSLLSYYNTFSETLALKTLLDADLKLFIKDDILLTNDYRLSTFNLS